LIAVESTTTLKRRTCFIMTPGADPTRKGSPYEMEFQIEDGFAGVQMVYRPFSVYRLFRTQMQLISTTKLTN
jgi:hypothetical protein